MFRRRSTRITNTVHQAHSPLRLRGPCERAFRADIQREWARLRTNRRLRAKPHCRSRPRPEREHARTSTTCLVHAPRLVPTSRTREPTTHDGVRCGCCATNCIEPACEKVAYSREADPRQRTSATYMPEASSRQMPPNALIRHLRRPRQLLRHRRLSSRTAPQHLPRLRADAHERAPYYQRSFGGVGNAHRISPTWTRSKATGAEAVSCESARSGFRVQRCGLRAGRFPGEPSVSSLTLGPRHRFLYGHGEPGLGLPFVEVGSVATRRSHRCPKVGALN
jgi:hypothetical protein